MKKRGVSEVVAVILIILLSVAAVIILWGVIKSLLSQDIDVSFVGMNVDIEEAELADSIVTYQTNDLTAEGYDGYDTMNEPILRYDGTVISDANINKMETEDNVMYNKGGGAGWAWVTLIWDVAENKADITHISLHAEGYMDCSIMCDYNKIYLWNDAGSLWHQLYTSSTSQTTKTTYDVSVAGSAGELVDYFDSDGDISFKFQIRQAHTGGIFLDNVDMAVKVINSALYLKVTRKSGGGDIDKLKIVISNEEESQIYTTEKGIGELETKVFNIKLEISNPTKVEIYPVVIKDGEEKIGSLIDSFDYIL